MGEVIQPKSLSEYSTDALVIELNRREKEFSPRRVKIVPCDECVHFKTWTKDSDPPEDYNPCAKSHPLLFKTPRGYDDTNWGFYRPGCKDRLWVDSVELHRASKL
jgi:hypothetical protein